MDRPERHSRIQHLIPREHGSWAMWVVPFLIGVAAGRKMTLWVPLLFIVSLLFFAARTALVNALRLDRRDAVLAGWVRKAGTIELVAAAALGAPALWWSGWPLIAVGLFAAALLAADLRWVRNRTERTVPAELLAVAGFSASSLVGYMAAAQHLALEALVIWGICAAYFCGSIFYVKMRLERRADRVRTFGPNARATLAYVVAVAVFAALLVNLGWVRGWVVLALSPWLVHVVVDLFWPRPLGNIHRLGWTLVAHSIGFTVLSIWLLQR